MNTTELIARGDFAHASLRMATAAYLARFEGQSRIHTESDLRAFLAWCDRQGLDPIESRRPHIELYLRWTGTPTTSSPRIWRQGRSPEHPSAGFAAVADTT